MSYRVEFKPSGLRDFQALSRPLQARVGRKFDLLASQPRPPGSRKLEGGEGHYRIRVGDYRVIYAVDDPRKIVWVVKIGHRGDVYRGL